MRISTIGSIVLAVLNLAAPAIAAQPPRLIVVVAVDQFPREYLTRFAPLFGDKGFRRLLNGGADFVECHYGHFGTLTAPGHSVMLTGAYPVDTGVVHNNWYSRTEGRLVGCVADKRRRLVRSPQADGTEEPGAAPPLSLSTTVGDGLRLATGMQAKVVSAAIKDRSAILLAGQRPSGVYWLDDGTCGFVTSTYYTDRLPSWVARFNETEPCKRYLGSTWAKFRSDFDYERYADVDDAPYERPGYGLGRTFPHPIAELTDPSAIADRYAAVTSSPFGNEVLLSFARTAIESEQLGADEVTDLLALGFSSNDLVGHGYGPHSQEVLDATLRTDALLAELLDFLDLRVGSGRWTLVLTSDHGIAPVPEYLEKRGFLTPRDDHYRRSSTTFQTTINKALHTRFLGASGQPTDGGELIAAWVHPFVYLNRAVLDSLRPPVSFQELVDVVRSETLRLDGVARVYTRAERESLAGSSDPIERRAYRSWHPENGGDLLVVMRPYWLDIETITTTHGSPYRYDTHVPLLWYGAGIRPGRYPRPVEVADLAPTLAQLLELTAPPMSVGAPLHEALQD